jgi:predicted TPR repeat methyltransferase
LTSLLRYKERYGKEVDLKGALFEVGDNHFHESWAQPAFMMSVGLRKRHMFLDLGCGCLRGTSLLVDYLDQGNFHGADVSQPLLNQCGPILKYVDVKNKPILHLINDYDFFKLTKTKFDYILSVSVLTHVLPDDIETFFRGVAGCLKPNGTYYFTIYPLDDGSFKGDMERMCYNIDYLKKVGDNAGLLIQDIPGEYHNLCNNFIDKVNTPMLGQWVLKGVLK